MTLLLFVAAALYGGWKARSVFQALVISGAIGLLNFFLSLDRIEVYRQQAELGNSTSETAFLVAFMVVFTWLFFFVIALVAFALGKVTRNRRSTEEKRKA